MLDVGPTLYKCHTNVLCFLGSHKLSNIIEIKGLVAKQFSDNNI